MRFDLGLKEQMSTSLFAAKSPSVAQKLNNKKKNKQQT